MSKKKNATGEVATYIVEAQNAHTVVIFKTIVPKSADELSDLRANHSG